MMPRHRAAEPSGNRARGTSTHRNDRRFRVPVLTGALSISAAWFARLPQALAIGLGLVPADPEYAGRLRSAQIAAIVRLTPLTLGASCLNAAILFMALGRMRSLRPGLWIWSALVFALAAYYGRNWRGNVLCLARRSRGVRCLVAGAIPGLSRLDGADRRLHRRGHRQFE